MDMKRRGAPAFTMPCTVCGEPWTQPDGSVTTGVCDTCRPVQTARFWAAVEAGGNLAELASGLLRQAFHGV